MRYYIVVNTEENSFNVFDEENLEHIPRGNQVIATIEGHENVNQAMKLIWLLRPDMNEVKPSF